MSSWDSDQLWLKAKLFADQANEHDQGSSEFAFNSSLALECLARAALTHVHPALNADPRDDKNLLYGFGIDVKGTPRSLPAHSVYIRLEKIVDGFGRPQRELCDFVALQRNAYLHTADLPYDNLSPKKWLPRYYETVNVLAEFLGQTLDAFVGQETAVAARGLIASLNEATIKAAKSKISACKQVWEMKGEEEKQQLRQTAKSATAFPGWGNNAVDCPACGSIGTLSGEAVKEFPEKYDDGELLMDVEFMAIGFRCVACGLSLKGVEEIAHADLDTHFVETTSTSLHDLYEPDYYREYDNM
jgi:hypothetical protein